MAAADVILENGRVRITDGVLNVEGPDICVDVAGRRSAKNKDVPRRALVHDFGDRLTLNWGHDYPAGIALMGPIVADGGMQVTGGLTADSTRVHGGLSVGGAVDATSLQAGALRAGETNVDGSLRVKGGLVAGGEVLLRSELFLVKKKGGPGDIGVHPGSGELSIQAAQKRDLQLRERAAKEFGGGANDYTVVHVLAKLEELRNELTALKAKVDAMK